MTNDNPRSLDVREFLELLYGEVLTGISLGSQARGVDRGLLITKVTVRFGFDPTSDGSSEVSLTIDDPILPRSVPWEIDVTLEPDHPTDALGVTVAELAADAARRRTRGTAWSPFDHYPVGAIQGVGAASARLLADLEIDTIRELADLDDLSPFGSRWALVLEFRTKARLACSTVPVLLPSSANPISLHVLAHRTPDELFQLIGSTAVSRARCDHLSTYLALLMLALDDQRLKEVTLAQLVRTVAVCD